MFHELGVVIGRTGNGAGEMGGKMGGGSPSEL